MIWQADQHDPTYYINQLLAWKWLSTAMHICLFLCPLMGFSQPKDDQLIQLTILDGLSDHRITSIVQDEFGYIWIGTYEGLNRYDGLEFKKYFRSDAASSLPDNCIDKLENIGPHRLAILTRGGMQILNTQTYQAINFLIADSTAIGIYMNRFWDVIEIENKGYLTSTNTGFYLFDYTGHLIWRYDHYTIKDIHQTMRYGRELYKMPDGTILCYYGNDANAKLFNPGPMTMVEVNPDTPAHAYLRPIVQRKKGSVIPLNKSQLMLTRPDDDKITIYNLTKQQSFLSEVPIDEKIESTWRGFLVQVNDTLIIQAGANGGYFMLDRNLTTNMVTSTGFRHFGNHRCTAILVDKNNRWWIGTEYGLYKQTFTQQSISKHNVRAYIEKYAKLIPVHVVHYHDGLVYFAAGNKDGVTVMDATSGKFLKSIRLPISPPEWNDVFCIENLNPDTLWFGSREGLIYYTPSTNASGIITSPPFDKGSTAVTSSFKDSRSNIWLSCSGHFNGILLYDQPTKTFIPYSSGDSINQFPLSHSGEFAEDHEGNIWIGKKGIARFNYSKMQFDTSMHVLAGPQKFQDNILALSADTEGQLWFSTEASGLYSYSMDTKTFTTYPAEILSRQSILAISPPVQNKLFLGNRSFIDLFDLETHKARVLGPKDGLPLAPISSSFVLDTEHQALWAAYDDDIVRIPFSLETGIYPLPNLLIESVSISNDSIILFPGQRITLPFDRNSLRINFTWFDFDDSDHVRTYYRLHPQDEWIDLNVSNTIILDHLASAVYNLEVKIKSATRRWPDQVNMLVIEIQPPFWKSTWFILLMSMAFIAGTFLLYRRHLASVTAKGTMDKLLADYEMKALHSQMNPHFIFNCLNSIKEMILLGDKDKAGFYLSRFAQLIRDTLEHSRRNFITLEQLIDYISRYIEMEKIRFTDFQYTITVDKEVRPREIKMPPILIQPLIENAIWHGLSLIHGEKKLDVHFFYRDDKLVCRITDNGIGIIESMKHKDESHTSTGIDNIQKRIALLNQKYHMSSSLTITDRSTLDGTAQGTIAELVLLIEFE